MSAPVRWPILATFLALSLCTIRPGLAQTKGPDTNQPKPCLEFKILKQPAKSKNAQNDSPEAKIRRALEARVRVKLVNTKLDSFCRELAKKFGINVMLDHKALKVYGFGGVTPLNFSCHDLSVKTVLRRILRDHDSTWIILHEVLMITSEQEYYGHQKLEVYDVADLATIPRGKGEFDFDLESLIKLITSMIEPESCCTVGNCGIIVPFEQDRLQVLVISETNGVHEEITNLLADLRLHLPKKALGKEDLLAGQSSTLEKNRKEDQPLIRKTTSPEEKIYRVLDKKIDLNLEKVPLSQFAARLERMLGISVRIDVESLDEMDLSYDIPVTVHLSSIPAQYALALALGPIDLDYMILEDCLLISLKDDVKAYQKTRIYDVGDLVESGDTDLSASDFESLIEIITACDKAESWVGMGGGSTIEPFIGGGMRVLVIKQTWSTHYQIEKLLDQIRKVRREGHGRPFPPNYHKKSNDKAKDENVFFSPMSISTAVAMAHAGVWQLRPRATNGQSALDVKGFCTSHLVCGCQGIWHTPRHDKRLNRHFPRCKMGNSSSTRNQRS